MQFLYPPVIARVRRVTSKAVYIGKTWRWPKDTEWFVLTPDFRSIWLERVTPALRRHAKEKTWVA